MNHVIYEKGRIKWQFQKEDNQKPAELKEELMISFRHPDG
jgi:hypothetical protein